MLIGTYKNNLLEKNRLAFPKKFREELGQNIIVMKGYENCLMVVNKEKFSLLLESLKEIPFVNSDIRDTRRFLIGSAVEIELDKQGRFVLPVSLKEYAKLITAAVFIGLLDWIEIWDEKAWNEKESTINSNSKEVSTNISKILEAR